MKILIIEDEERSFMRLKRLLENIDGKIEICGPTTSVSDTVGVLSRQDGHYDIIFADIRLEDGDVFDVFLQVQPTAPIIFTTAYNEYALEAFRSNGIAYLLKPIVPAELQEALDKAKKLVADNAPLVDYSGLLASLGLERKDYREHFLVQTYDGYTVLSVREVSHFFTENGITQAYLHNGKSIRLNSSLNDIEEKLDPKYFFRASRQYIVGVDSIDRIFFHFNHKLAVKLKAYPNVDIIVSKERAALLKEWIDR